MSTRISATELSRRLSDVLSRVRYRGEAFVIERNGEPVARLEPLPAGAPVTWRVLADRLRGLASNDPTFADDLEALQETQPKVSFTVWPS